MDPQDQPQFDKLKAYVHLEQALLGRKDFTPADKLVAARISGFEEFYESPTATAEFLGLSVISVKRAKIKLEKLGALVVIKDDGRGKRYRVDHAALIQQKNQIDTQSQTRPANLIQQVYQIETAGVSNCDTENKERLNGEERLSLKDKSFKEAHEPEIDSEDSSLKDKLSARFGNAEINDFLDQWQEATGFDWHGVRQERFAAKNLIAKYGSEAMKPLLRRVQAARRSTDQFAPQIAKPSQLVGKYEKLTALTMWEERQQKAQNPTPTPTRPVIEGPQVPRGPVYEHDVREDKTEEELRAECQSIREKYKGTKFEHIFNGGRK